MSDQWSDSPSGELDDYRRRAGLSLPQLWGAYIALGGDLSWESFLGSYETGLSAFDRNLLAVVLNENLGDAADVEGLVIAGLDRPEVTRGYREALEAGDGLAEPQWWRSPGAGFDLPEIALRLGPSGTIDVLGSEPDLLERQAEQGASTGSRLVRIDTLADASWESHPAGDEVMMVLAGEVEIHLEASGAGHQGGVRPLRPGQMLVVPRGQWHRHYATTDSRVLLITSLEGTQRRP